jgi:hypothetical protein
MYSVRGVGEMQGGSDASQDLQKEDTIGPWELRRLPVRGPNALFTGVCSTPRVPVHLGYTRVLTHPQSPSSLLQLNMTRAKFTSCPACC